MNTQFTCRVCGFHEFRLHNSELCYCLNCETIFKSPDKFTLPSVKFIKLSDKAITPEKAHGEGDVGFDLFAAESKEIPSQSVTLIKTNIAIELPPNTEAQVRCRSGMGKKGIQISNGPGTIDPSYRGDIGVLLYNSTLNCYNVQEKDKIAQLLITTKLPYQLIEVNQLSNTDRGSNGYGSTGK